MVSISVIAQHYLNSEEKKSTIIDNLAFDQGRTSSRDMTDLNSVWTSSFLRINEEGKLVGRHLGKGADNQNGNLRWHLP